MVFVLVLGNNLGAGLFIVFHNHLLLVFALPNGKLLANFKTALVLLQSTCPWPGFHNALNIGTSWPFQSQTKSTTTNLPF
jgi:hypothetical protein